MAKGLPVMAARLREVRRICPPPSPKDPSMCILSAMPWYQLSFPADRPRAPALTESLEEAGALSVTLEDLEDQPLFEPPPGEAPLWERLRLSALFETREKAEQAASRLGVPNYHIDVIGDKDWQAVCRQSFPPLRFGRIEICPSWHTPDPGAVSILLDPGLAFGTGTHPTTALCLSWLEAQALQGKVLIDYGCGSGILGIAAARLGAEVWAVDIDPQALEAAATNAERNAVRLRTCLPWDLPPLRTHFLVANILANPLVELAPTLACHLLPQGRIALSGILAEQVREVGEAYRPFFAMEAPAFRDEWARLSGTRLSSEVKLSPSALSR